jgi:hypothetical protein
VLFSRTCNQAQESNVVLYARSRCMNMLILLCRHGEPRVVLLHLDNRSRRMGAMLEDAWVNGSGGAVSHRGHVRIM